LTQNTQVQSNNQYMLSCTYSHPTAVHPTSIV